MKKQPQQVIPYVSAALSSNSLWINREPIASAGRKARDGCSVG
jgi:hypothetical protein